MTIYIVDPVCVQSLGHNLTAIKRYGNLIKEIKKETVFLLTSRFLSEDLRISGDLGIFFEGFFSHYYPDFISINGANVYCNGESGLKKNLGELASKELMQFFEKFSPNKNDTIFYPSIDYFSLFALVQFLETTPSERIPKIIIRFIGVMEYDLYKTGVTLVNLLEKIRFSISEKNIKIKFSAESGIMAKHIEDITGQYVEVTPTLVSHDALSQNKNDVFTIVFPGSARRDKGFDRIASILDCLDKKNPSKKYRAIVQLLPPSELKHFGGHALELVKNSKVTLLPCSLDEAEILDLFKISDLVVAPYDPNVYKYRSSAIMAEAATYGRPIVASKNCGFSDQIEKYGLGLLAESDADFSEKIDFFREMQDSERESYAHKVREKFMQFMQSSYINLFK